ncbi:MAG: replicative DNA helicase [bacterium]|nr:replicative DNA helicase [Mycoplasmatota bacterium]MDD6757520.1 replicative DNA helicase [bacterium]MDY2908896.1 replicative DNA helicase [Candidatus Faecimonas sp.]
MPIKTLPNNIEAEQSVLGACFLSKYALQKACESLTPDSFYDEKNGKIFSAMNALVDEKTPIDITTVTGYLKKNNQLTEIGGVEYLTEVLNFVPTASNIDYYIKNVEDASILRKLIETATDIASEGYRTDETVNEILDNSEKKILNIVKNRKSSEFRSIKDILQKTQSDLERLSEHKGEVTGLATGWYDIDKLTTGLHPNELIIIAARPAMGKTVFALNLATHAAMTQDKSVALFNLEMSAEQLAMRILSSLGQVDGFKLRTGNLMNTDWKRINEAVSQLSNTNLVMDDTPGITIGEIRAKCRRLASSEKGLSLVVIDYLQLISGGKNYGANRQQEVSDISRSLKTLAMELQVPVIALSQLSRSVEAREDKRPIMSDLRESGSIEQDADIVAFLYRDDYYKKEARNEDNTSIVELIVGKHRNGPTATVELLFKKDTSTMLNLSKGNRGEE